MKIGEGESLWIEISNEYGTKYIFVTVLSMFYREKKQQSVAKFEKFKDLFSNISWLESHIQIGYMFLYQSAQLH